MGSFLGRWSPTMVRKLSRQHATHRCSERRDGRGAVVIDGYDVAVGRRQVTLNDISVVVETAVDEMGEIWCSSRRAARGRPISCRASRMGWKDKAEAAAAGSPPRFRLNTPARWCAPVTSVGDKPSY